ncbi:Protein ZBED8-like [Oopsacas minuta]|uniref:Protein ZBED8-like n=1 Tax=Oopsacas minuta TaxID=111878 RepID=A0AAV7KH84_9METZ|nr:Protein ZBED8-like [Oopsacas minuta]
MYLVDIFDRINVLNLSLQGKEKYMFDLSDKLKAFQMKIHNWRRKIDSGNVCKFERLSEYFDYNDIVLDNNSKTIISEHLTALGEEFSHYYPEWKDSDLKLPRNPFTFSPQAIPDDNDRAQEELIDLINDGSAKELFESEELSTFWCSMEESYPLLAEIILKRLLPFPTTYLCESGFSALLQIKTSTRNKLKVEDDLRCALTNTDPEIQDLVKDKQLHPSH